MFRSWRLTALIGFLIGLLFLQSRYRLTLVVGDSMEPTLHAGDLLLVDKTAYRKIKPARGDVVVCRYRNELVVKRVVGLAAEEIEINQGNVEVNGCAIPEPYLTRLSSLKVDAGTISNGKIALDGDNREMLHNSMVLVIATTESVVGKVR